MKKQINVFHIGESSSNQAASLSERFKYHWLPVKQIFQYGDSVNENFWDDSFGEKEKRSIFIIEKLPEMILSENLLKQLPAHQIIYNIDGGFSEKLTELLILKEAIPMPLVDMEKAFKLINLTFGIKQQGYKISNDSIMVHKNFDGHYRKLGNAYIELSGIFPENYAQVATWRMTNLIQKADEMVFYPEIEVLEGEADILFKIFMIKENSNQIINVVEASLNQIKEKLAIPFISASTNAYVNVSMYARGGVGTFRVGQLHIRRAVGKGNVMVPGGRKIHDEEKLDDEVFYHFNAGDLKPPLAVYFSGYRSAEGFEGLGMMSKMGCPYLLIADPRLEGGNFYLGSEAFEKKIVKIISDKLELLGFTNSELLLSGLSMGTFGALYYASDLSPSGVIIGKPLTNIGTIAMNGRINRPDEFATAFDMVKFNTDTISQASAQALDERFWLKFQAGNYVNTTFAVAFMKQDDYDKEAFPMLFKILKEKYPATRILYHGFIGRHNDNSAAINRWFVKQYRNLMLSKYNRTIGRII
ncbi:MULTISPECIES: accessory Sec system protein Asp2 [unclassified Enterococcus]|uniref:accessory Sec system protein Asp2 n=1 Tax=unclassified Enterococcus TaxID=2608891 RepID=UPI001552A4C3|nr:MULTISPECIES: accessory Sec system protein Asp2 [unclassified Enterococcus]MBS7576335.1 accessory Sec system protein Asp2 [Enterococcus sp. MMGLQ5-2]MBS7583567.1 accessory Sec system protein Asp2 [Enterococcus sp. MMGLQ5-1]NPD11429.1 accessory Sec system protein Asp2 [Enterococcus sp. MMGLQ5-1]NPD36173.1 accessory Sec system protein Asp2 [Enterococcus sp. MMGLQ5-2]